MMPASAEVLKRPLHGHPPNQCGSKMLRIMPIVGMLITMRAPLEGPIEGEAPPPPLDPATVMTMFNALLE